MLTYRRAELKGLVRTRDGPPLSTPAPPPALSGCGLWLQSSGQDTEVTQFPEKQDP